MQSNQWSKAAVDALFLSLITILANLIQVVLEPGKVISILIWLIKFGGCLGVLYYFMKEFSKSSEVFSYKDGLKFGFKICLLSSLICAGYVFFQFAVLFPDMMQKTIEQYSTAMSSSNPDAIEVMERYMTPQFISVITFIYYVVFGLIVSAIIANYTKKGDVFTETNA